MMQKISSYATGRLRASLLIALLCVGFSQMAFAQETKFKNDTLSIKKNDDKGKPPLKEGQAQPQDDKKNRDFEPKRQLSIVSEDTTSINEDFTSVIQVSDFLKIDCVWVKAAEYYSVWNSKYINPYNINPASFKDTIRIKLYDEEKEQYWAKPLERIVVTSVFGYRWRRFHHGADLSLKMGEPIYALFDGIVRIAAFDRGYGNYVVMRHYNGLETLYAHMSKITSEVGQVIKAGEQIGLGGSTGWSTGPHLHLEVRYAGNTLNPFELCDFYDPENLIRGPHYYITPRSFKHLGVGGPTKTVAGTANKKEYVHIVRSGDTLSGIARRYGVSIKYLTNLNRISANGILRVGQRIRIR
jgi:murein DD-endopeptidase MepM/ murein hydrolase activator NlpD